MAILNQLASQAPLVMAAINSENRTCASESLIEMYGSAAYTICIIINCIIPIISMYFLGYAIKQLCSQSIIQRSTRILLISTLMYAMCHQIAYFSFKIDLLYTMLFKLSDPCNLQHSSYDCRFITIGTTTGNCGLALTHLAMSIERIIAISFSKKYYKVGSIPGIVLVIVVLVISFSMWFILTVNDPLTGYVNHCGFYPTYSVAKFNKLLDATLYLSVFNFILDLVLLYAQREILWKGNYDFLNRFESRISLRCTQAIFLISTCQSVSNCLYSGLTSLFMALGSQMSAATYSLCLSIIYTTPYACLVLPLLISRVLNYIKVQRTVGILSLRNQKPGLEEHMKRMRLAWS